jgi:hypothetical protein
MNWSLALSACTLCRNCTVKNQDRTDRRAKKPACYLALG